MSRSMYMSKPRVLVTTERFRMVETRWREIRYEKRDGKDHMGVTLWRDVPEDEYPCMMRQIGQRMSVLKDRRRRKKKVASVTNSVKV